MVSEPNVDMGSKSMLILFPQVHTRSSRNGRPSCFGGVFGFALPVKTSQHSGVSALLMLSMIHRFCFLSNLS
jgi:hypothetical protein